MVLRAVANATLTSNFVIIAVLVQSTILPKELGTDF
jgi:hypothetical protein